MADSANNLRSKRLARLSTGALTTALTLGGLTALTGVAGAVPGTPAQAVTDYTTYPANVPAGCDGDSALTGVQFENDGRTAGELNELYPLRAGDVTMTWTGYAPGCEGMTVSLASYRLIGFAPHPANSAVTVEVQRLNDGWEYLAPGATGPFSLSVEVPASPDGCYRQLDAALGLPLAQIGTGGSWYSNHMRIDEGPNMLVSHAGGGAAEVCAEATPVPPTPPVTPPTTPAPPAPEPTPEVQPEAPTPAPTPEPEAEVAPAAPPAPVAAAPQTQVLGITAARALPVTGTNATPWLAGMSALLLAAGTALAGQGRRLARRSA